MKVKLFNKEIKLSDMQNICVHSNYKRFKTTYGDETCRKCGVLLKSERNNINKQ